MSAIHISRRSHVANEDVSGRLDLDRGGYRIKVEHLNMMLEDLRFR